MRSPPPHVYRMLARCSTCRVPDNNSHDRGGAETTRCPIFWHWYCLNAQVIFLKITLNFLPQIAGETCSTSRFFARWQSSKRLWLHRGSLRPGWILTRKCSRWRRFHSALELTISRTLCCWNPEKTLNNKGSFKYRRVRAIAAYLPLELEEFRYVV